MALPANFLDELRARTPIAGVIGRTVKLTRSGRERKGCCPFHGEKSPSFYVYDDHYHCFGCGEHGDVITFVMKTTGASFMEAVEELARQAGMEVPKPTPQAAQAEQHRAGLTEVLEAAARQYQEWLFAPEGKKALEYLRGRGLSDTTIRKFGLGWSGEGRGHLAGALRGQGIKPDQLIEARRARRGGHVLCPCHVPHPRPARRADQLRRAHHGRWPAEIRERPGDRRVLQAALALRAEPRPRRGAQGREVDCR
jgi:DNA primase